MGYLTENVLKIAGFPTKCPQASLAAFSRSARHHSKVRVQPNIKLPLLSSANFKTEYDFKIKQGLKYEDTIQNEVPLRKKSH